MFSTFYLLNGETLKYIIGYIFKMHYIGLCLITIYFFLLKLQSLSYIYFINYQNVK